MKNILKMNKIKNPKISVVMSVYSEPNNFIKESIESILNQTYDNFEFIIVNDSLRNKRIKKILDYYANKSKKIKLINNDNNIGLIDSLNKALIASTGDYIARMDADDISVKNRFEEQIKFLLRNSSCVLVGSEAILIDHKNKIIGYRSRKSDYLSIRRNIFLNNQFIHPSIMVRKSFILNRKYNKKYKHAEDYDLFIYLTTRNIVSNIKKPLIYYRITPNQITNKKWLITRINSSFSKLNHLFTRFNTRDFFMLLLSLLILPVPSRLTLWIKDLR